MQHNAMIDRSGVDSNTYPSCLSFLKRCQGEDPFLLLDLAFRLNFGTCSKRCDACGSTAVTCGVGNVPRSLIRLQSGRSSQWSFALLEQVKHLLSPVFEEVVFPSSSPS